MGPDGGLYGTTGSGGSSSAGMAFNLRPSPSACLTALCPWTETLLYSFKGGFSDASGGGELAFDRTGNLYGTSWGGGSYGGGAVYQLTHTGGGWTEQVIYNFEIGLDGYNPVGSVTPDGAGSIYGTNFTYAAIIELSPSGSGWVKTVLYRFQGNENPNGGLIFDPLGNLYGTNSTGGPDAVFKLVPSDGKWTFWPLYSVPGAPNSNLVMDAAGNLYGTTVYGGSHGMGNVFKLTSTDDGWVYSSLHDFAGGPADGAGPNDGVTLGANGRIYGTTYSGGLQQCQDMYGNLGCGVVFEITP